MKKLLLYLSLVLWACEAPQEESSQVPIIPNIIVNKTTSELVRKGPSLLRSDTLYSGFTVDYYANGQLKSKTGYFKGLREGKSVKHYPDGSLLEKRDYRDNKKHGNHLGWWPNGNSKFDYHFEKGLQEGLSKEWHNSGQPFRFFTYEKGKEVGSQKMWEDDGTIRANYVVKDNHRYGLIGLKNCKSASDEKGVFTAKAY